MAKSLSLVSLPESTTAFWCSMEVYRLAREKHALLKIPSVVTKGDFNYLINPDHRDFPRIEIAAAEKFPFDKRIFK